MLLDKPTYNLFRLLLFILFSFVIITTISNGWHYDYRLYNDDTQSVTLFKNLGIIEGTVYLYNHDNGRLVSHFLSMLFSPMLIYITPAVIIIYLLNIALFISSLAFFLKKVFEFRYHLSLSGENSFMLSCLIYSCFFLFSFDKRFEFWYWLSSSYVYQYSIILMLVLNGILLQRDYTHQQLLFIAVISFCLGFMSEIQATAQMFLFIILLFNRDVGINKSFGKDAAIKIWGLLIIMICVGTNYLSQGNMHKLLISKTNIFDVSNLEKAVDVFINDLVFKSNYLIVRYPVYFEINSSVIQIFSLLLLTFFLYAFFKSSFYSRREQAFVLVKRNNGWQFLIVSVLIFIFCCFITTFMYARLVESIADRYKMVGYFLMFMSASDIIITSVLSRKNPLA